MQTDSYIKEYLKDDKKKKDDRKRNIIIAIVVLVCIFNPTVKLRKTIYGNAEKIKSEKKVEKLDLSLKKTYEAPLQNSKIYKPYGEIQLAGEGKEFHSGVDLMVSSDTYVEVVEEGEVVFTGYDEDLENTVIVKHVTTNDIFYTVYGHLSTNYTYLGQKLDKRHIIGEALLKDDELHSVIHFEVRESENKGTDIDPDKYI